MACKKDKSTNPNLPVANFTLIEDTIPYGIGSNLVFEMTNTSTNATSYIWDFGGEYTDTTTNGRIAYTATDVNNFFTSQEVPDGMLHTNQITLTAIKGSKTSVKTKTVSILEEF